MSWESFYIQQCLYSYCLKMKVHTQGVFTSDGGKQIGDAEFLKEVGPNS